MLEAYIPASGKKKLLRSGAPLSGVSEMIGDFTAVLFCPEHLSLVSGSSRRQAQFFSILHRHSFRACMSASFAASCARSISAMR